MAKDRQFHMLDDAQRELYYIRSIDPAQPGRDYNDDPACFRSYVTMQAKRFDACGWILCARMAREHAGV